jgi:hypothetical protein
MSATTHSGWREHWEDLKRGRPGHRFQDRYARARKSAKAGALQRLVFLIGGIVALLIGVVLVVIPGPAVPFFFLAGGMLATESRVIARFMDWSEVRVRNVLAWGKRRWKHLPQWARIALVVLGAACSAATAYLSYRFFRD